MRWTGGLGSSLLPDCSLPLCPLARCSCGLCFPAVPLVLLSPSRVVLVASTCTPCPRSWWLRGARVAVVVVAGVLGGASAFCLFLLRGPPRVPCDLLSSSTLTPALTASCPHATLRLFQNRNRAAIRWSGSLDDTLSFSHWPPYDNSSRNALASCKSCVAKPSGNRPSISAMEAHGLLRRAHRSF